MRTYALVCLLILAAGAAGAQTYRWVDERGVTNYGEQPPAGRAAQPVNVQPAGTVESREAAKARVTEAPAAEPAPAVAAPMARGMEFETYIRLQPGMTEAELHLRAGKPDHESVDNARHDIVKSLYYYPTSSNPYLTVVTVRGGRIANIERNRKTY
jgi:hypothetical protein